MTMRSRWLVTDGAAVLGVYLVAIVVANASRLRAGVPAHVESVLAAAVVVDLVITASALHFLFGIRLGRLPRWTMLPVAAVGLLVAHWLYPSVGGLAATAAMGATVLVELLALGTILARCRRLVRTYAAARHDGRGRFEAMESGLGAVLPALLARATATELKVLVLAVAGWAWRPRAQDPCAFTVHRKAHWSVVAGVLAFLTIPEGALVHLLLERGGYPTAAWIASALHLYAVLWLCGDAQAFRLEPIRVARDSLHLRFGIRWSSRIPWRNIARVERITAPSTSDESETLRMILIGPPNVRLSLREHHPVSGLMGIQKHVTAIELAVDEPDRFAAEVADYLDRGA